MRDVCRLQLFGGNIMRTNKGNMILKVNSKIERTEYIPFGFNISSYNVINFNINSRDVYKMILVLEGEIELETQGNIVKLRRNQVEIINPSKTYVINPHEKNLIIELNVDKIIFSRASDINEITNFCISENEYDDKAKMLVELFKNLFYLYVKDNVVSSNMLVAVLNEISILLNSNFIQSDDESIGSSKPWLELKLMEIMERMYKKPGKYVLNELADEVGMKPSNFSNFFKKVSGCGFVDFHHYSRLEKSISLLSNNEYSISEIAELSGFSSSKTLSESFKKYVGMTPLSVRKHITNNINEYKYMSLNNILSLSVLEDIFIEYSDVKLFSKTDIDFMKEKIFDVNANDESKAVVFNSGFSRVADTDIYEGEWFDFYRDNASNLKHEYMRINLCFEDGKIYSIENIAEKEILNPYDVNYYIQEFHRIGLNPMLVLEFPEKTIDMIIEHSFDLKCIGEIIDFFDFIASNVPMRNLKNWMVEIKMPSLWSKRYEHDRHLLNKKLYTLVRDLIISRSSITSVGVNIGEVSLIEDQLLMERMEEIVMNGNSPKFFSYDVIDETLYITRDDSECILLRIISQMDRMTKYIDELKKKYFLDAEVYLARMIMYYDWNGIPKQYWESIQALSLVSSYLLFQMNKVVVCSSFSFNRFFDSRKEFVKSIGDFDSKYTMNNIWDIKSLNYYIRMYLEQMSGLCIYNEPGLIVTKNKDDYSCILYQDMANCIKYILSDNGNNEFPVKNFRVRISGMVGRFKIITKTLKSSEGNFYCEFKKLGAQKFLTMEEKEYLKNRVIPEMRVENINLFGVFDKTFSLDLFEIMFLEIKKINI